MKVVVQVKLLPDAVQASALAATLSAVNDAVNWVSGVGFSHHELRASVRDLRKLCYGELKARGLGSQAAQHVIKRAVDACTMLRANIRNGNLGGPSSKRRVKACSKPIRFRPDAAHTFDDRCLSWQHDAGTVSIWTMHGRLKNLRFTGSANQLKTLREHRHGESDLICRDGLWFLIATCDIPEPDVIEPADWIGVDRGITNLASTSDGDNFSGRRLHRYRRWHARKRAELQAKRTRSATRRLKRRARKEARHSRHVNHRIASEIVAVAQRTGRGVALEELGGIRDRVTVARHQRATHSSWPFHQLGEFITYKARRARVPVLVIDARYTSQTCPRCTHVSRSNRPARDHFRCRQCGLAGPADVVAAVNIRNRARRAWVFVNMPAPSPDGEGWMRPAHDSQPRTGTRPGLTDRAPRSTRQGREVDTGLQRPTESSGGAFLQRLAWRHAACPGTSPRDRSDHGRSGAGHRRRARGRDGDRGRRHAEEAVIASSLRRSARPVIYHQNRL
ncbi:RNA-guided endonuclease InsQ/TnpB family protein [Lentzea indica]|uniref:RNA-guided endonuclease InsQ/TnpB family protein n=1 Tax=Lentzea indica TaxID=2604800 RepID=UPI001CB73FCD|nr:RNA-guided endonuclease TnpB family protein [Lentzea indica]